MRLGRKKSQYTLYKKLEYTTVYNPSLSLRSHNSGLLVVPRIAKSTKGGREFLHLATKLLNSLTYNVWAQTHSFSLNLD